MKDTSRSFVDFIIPVYNRYDLIRCMLYSLISQYDPDWTAQVIIDDVKNDTLIDIINDIKDKRISYTFTYRRCNDWGHTPREIGKQQSKSQYIVMTGDDNYYVPTLVGEIKKAVEDNNMPSLVYWDMVHNYWDYSSRPSLLCAGSIDMGAFATRRDLAQQIKLPTSYCADAEFIIKVQDLIKLAKKEVNYDESRDLVHINKILFIHN